MRLTVDVHAHVLLPKVEAVVAGRSRPAAAQEVEARRQGPVALAVNGTMLREPRSRPTDVSARLAAMDAQGVDVQLVSPSPSHYHYWADEKRNEEISSHVTGRELSDTVYETFWSRVEKTGTLVFLHSWLHPRRTSRPVVPVRHCRPADREHCRPLAPHLLGGVGPRPELKLTAAQGGGCLPTHIGRSDHAWTARSDVGAGCARLHHCRRRRPDPPGLRLPLRHGHRRPRRRSACRPLPDAGFDAVRGGNAAALLNLT